VPPRGGTGVPLSHAMVPLRGLSRNMVYQRKAKLSYIATLSIFPAYPLVTLL
jgi:hypothetical protein